MHTSANSARLKGDYNKLLSGAIRQRRREIRPPPPPPAQ
jgi:hypothetical protein